MQRRNFLAIAGFTGLAGATTLGQSVPAGSNLVPDGRTLNTTALQALLDHAAALGGGTVTLPQGIFLTGGLVLRSRVTLHIPAGATLLGSTKPEDYAYHPGPPQEGDANGRHLIFAIDAQDIAVVGQGTIDGQGAAFWRRKGRPSPKPEEMWGDVIAWDYEAATQRRPAPMLEFARCKNVRVEGVTLQNAPSWTMRPVACESVFIRGVRVRNPIYAPNTDGMDITACTNVFVSDCDIQTGDDAICIKSENPYGDLLPTRNITVTNCVLSTCCNGFKIGTATHGRVENVVFSNSVIFTDDSAPWNHRATSGIALETVDGGSLDGITISNIRMQNARTPLFVRLGSRTPGTNPSFVRNISLSQIEASGALLTSSITGVPGLRPTGITLSGIRIHSDEAGQARWAAAQVPEQKEFYPEARMFGRLPAAALYVRHADRVRVRDFEFRSSQDDARPTIVADDVHDFDVDAMISTTPAGGQPVVGLHNTTDAFLHSSQAPPGTSVFLRVSGESSARIALAGNFLTYAKVPYELTDGANPASVTVS